MTLRLRVILAMGLIGVLVVAGAFTTRQLVERQLVDQVDARLHAATPDQRGDGGRPQFGPSVGGDSNRPFVPRGFSAFYVAVLHATGVLDHRLDPLGRTTLAAPKLVVADLQRRLAAGSRAPFTVDAVGNADLQYRVVVARSSFSTDALVVGAPLNDVADSLGRVERVVFAIAILVLLALALVTWWVIRLGVRPVKKMAITASAVAHEGDDHAVDLSHRVEVTAPRTEVGELGNALNAMLDRLEGSFDEQRRIEARLRQFVGDASHELRTPVQTIRGYTELYRLGALHDATKLDDAMRRSEQEAVRMAALVDDLLTLARFDNERPLRLEAVDVSSLAADAVANIGVIQPQRTIRLVAPEPVIVTGDDHALRQVFANVLGNAIVHTPIDAAISVSVRTVGDEAEVTIGDGGPGMAPELADKAFERFVRADKARTRHAGGSGLGLAIVHATVVAHGGTITLDTGEDRGTTVVVRIPLIRPA